MWLLDTNVISELRKPRPDTGLVSWLIIQPVQNLWTSDVCLAEIRAGIELQENFVQKSLLQSWYNEVVEPQFEGKKLSACDAVLEIWLRLIKQLQAMRKNAPSVDLLVAATCLNAKFTAVTRDTTPFIAAGVPTFRAFSGLIESKVNLPNHQ